MTTSAKDLKYANKAFDLTNVVLSLLDTTKDWETQHRISLALTMCDRILSIFLECLPIEDVEEMLERHIDNILSDIERQKKEKH